ncbi:kinesin-like protein KIN-7F [Henckelia pumila]|uniref:kinesin-like protein KIN-7F n=1 Tax=Henckelia pumila TaxID=405737 RepID=UPI003C6DB869
MRTMESGEEVMRGNEEKIYVSVRLRPLNSKEILRNDVSDWECIDDKTIVYKNVNLSASERSMYPSAYTFDRVFRTACSTREVYEKGAKDVAISAASGMNSSVFAYGQTSSGKTYTMTGITEYAISDIFEYIEKHPERKFSLKFSAMEIYNESVRDLLSIDCTPLRLLDDPERGTVVEKLTEEVLTDWDHVIQLLSICEAQRQVGETSLNETSSRSHQIIRLTIESSSRDFLGKGNASTLTAAVNFVDLAGSERASHSLSAGARLKEGCHINRSLLTLGTVVRKLSKGRNGHIPYRDSKLTRILQTSLGGNARTAIICTLSPARSHVEQSRNTLLFASCAKEVMTNAQVNVVLSDKALVKHLQRELARLESELRSPSSTFGPSNTSATLREKDLRIDELEKEIKEVILQRDIAQSQVKELLQMLGDHSGSMIQVELGHYSQLLVQNSLDSEIPELGTPFMADPHSLDVDTRTCSDGHSRSSSEDHFPKVTYFDDNFVSGNMSPRILIRSSNFSESDSCHGWDEVEKQSNGTSEYLYKEVRCIDAEESSNKGILYSSPEENTGFSAVQVSMIGDGQDLGFESPRLTKEQVFISSHLKNDHEMTEGTGFKHTNAKNDEELVSPSTFKKERELDFLDMSSLEKLRLARDLAPDSSGTGSLKLTKSRSCRASIITDSSSPWLKITDYSDRSPTSGSYREFKGLNRKVSPLNFSSSVRTVRMKDSQSSPENALDIEIDAKNVKFLNAQDVAGDIDDMKEENLLPDEQETSRDSAKEIEPKVNKSLKTSVKEVGADPVEDDIQDLSSWPREFERLQREIIELWQACNVSLVHRSYFFMLFQGDPSDSIYLEVEMRRMKFLNDKFSRGEKTIVNGQCLTLASSNKALRQERRMLSKQMSKKLSEHERESLFLKWGIGLNTKLRRLQLAYHIWTNTKDTTHIADSAFLVVKLVGLIEPGQAPKEMFGLNFTPRYSARNYSFRRSLTSLM